MTLSFSKGQLVMGRLLLILMFLESCDHKLLLHVPKPEPGKGWEELSNDSIAEQESAEEKPANFITLAAKELTGEGRHSITVLHREGELEEGVQINAPAGFSQTHTWLPVKIAEDTDLQQLPALNKEGQKKNIHLNLPKKDGPRRVTVHKAGLKGSGKFKQEAEGKGEKEEGKKRKARRRKDKEVQAGEGNSSKCQRLEAKENTSSNESIASEDFVDLPIELWYQILAAIEFPHILACISLNRTFYEIITGYDKAGLVGIENRPASSFYSNNWINSNKIADFKEYKFRTLMLATIPSFPWYRLLGEVRSLPQIFWPYISGTQIHTLDLHKVSTRPSTYLLKEAVKLALYPKSKE